MAPGAEPVKPDSLINREDGRKYWENAAADVDGMLGGTEALFGPVTRVDLQGSRTFLARLGLSSSRNGPKVENCLEGGAGIGRVTEGLLVNVADNIDIVEPIVKFTDKLKGKPGVRTVYNVGLEDWTPAEGMQYDLIWVQWCLGSLTDKQLVKFLEVCKGCLRPETGVLVVKENLSITGKDDFDPVDSAVTRLDESWKQSFQEAGLHLIKEEPQRGLPESNNRRLLPVNMYALKP